MPITTAKRYRAAAGRGRHRPRSLTTAGVEVRSSSRISTSTRNPRPTPGHPHSTLKSRYFRPIREQVAGCQRNGSVSPVLITTILMGTLGCVPAYDRFFIDGIKKHKVTTQEYSLKSVLRLAKFYEEHNDRLEEARRGMRTEDLTYPQMKLLDMGFWQVGFEKDAGSAR